MPTLEKVKSALLSPQIKQLWGLEEDEEIYLKIVRAGKVARIKQKMQGHDGLTHAEMGIAADLGLIGYEQFWYWTPETQAQVHRAEDDLKTRQHKTFDSVNDLFAALGDD